MTPSINTEQIASAMPVIKNIGLLKSTLLNNENFSTSRKKNAVPYHVLLDLSPEEQPVFTAVKQVMQCMRFELEVEDAYFGSEILRILKDPANQTVLTQISKKIENKLIEIQKTPTFKPFFTVFGTQSAPLPQNNEKSKLDNETITNPRSDVSTPPNDAF